MQQHDKRRAPSEIVVADSCGSMFFGLCMCLWALRPFPFFGATPHFPFPLPISIFGVPLPFPFFGAAPHFRNIETGLECRGQWLLKESKTTVTGAELLQ
jgi:hypothetical protein